MCTLNYKILNKNLLTLGHREKFGESGKWFTLVVGIITKREEIKDNLLIRMGKSLY